MFGHFGSYLRVLLLTILNLATATLMVVTSHALKINDHFNSNTLSMAGHVTRAAPLPTFVSCHHFKLYHLALVSRCFAQKLQPSASLSHSLFENFTVIAKLIGHKRQHHCSLFLDPGSGNPSDNVDRGKKEGRHLSSATGIIFSVCWNLTPSVMSDPDSHFAKHRI